MSSDANGPEDATEPSPDGRETTAPAVPGGGSAEPAVSGSAQAPPPRRKWWQLQLDQTSQIMIGCALLVVFGVVVVAVTKSPPIVGGLSCGVPALVFAIASLRKLRFDVPMIVIIIGGLVLYALYFTYTSYGERNYDGDSQLEYIQYLLKNKSLPDKSTCFICHHPPVYYILAALGYRLFEVTGLEIPTRGAQIVSLPAIFVFVVYGALTVRRFSDSRYVLRLATAFIVFWPYTVMNSVRMHNDVLVSTFIAAGVYHLIAWYQDGRKRHMWLVALFSVLAVLTKSNGFVVPAVTAMVVGWRFLRGPGRWHLVKRVAPPLLLAVASVGAYILHRSATSEGGATGGLLGTAYEIHPRDFVGNEPSNYLYFDLAEFIKEPYVMARRDGSGRQYYWNHLLKSSLFATHNNVPDSETSFRWNRRLAELMNAMLLAMLALGVGAVVMLKRGDGRRYFVLLVSTFSLIGVHIAFKATIPSGHHNDFRFVYPVVIACSLGYALATEAYRKRDLLLGRIAHGLGVTFIGMSIVYYLPTYDFVVAHFPKTIIRKAERDLKKPRNEQTEWDDAGNTIILGDEVVEIEISPARDISGFEITVDSNDKYDIEFYYGSSPDDVHHEIIGARPEELARQAAENPTTSSQTTTTEEKPFKGLARYTREFAEPIERVRAVRIRPVSGDRAYSLGHIVLH